MAATFNPFTASGAHTSDGSIYVAGGIGTPPSGIVRITSDASAAELVLDCQRQEFLFCNSQALVATGGPPSADVYIYHLAAPVLYRFDGAPLTPIGDGPLDDLSFISEVVRARNGDFYLTAAADNTRTSTRYLHKLVDGKWKKISAMPGHGSIAVDRDGVVYAGMSPQHLAGPASGGFWILR